MIPKSDDTIHTNDNNRNIVPGRLHCPVTDWINKNGDLTYTKKQLYYHWQKEHLANEGLSLKKFMTKSSGGHIFVCNSCQKGYSSKKGLATHKRRCNGPRNV